jgi:hypothetical protein
MNRDVVISGIIITLAPPAHLVNKLESSVVPSAESGTYKSYVVHSGQVTCTYYQTPW